MYTSKWKLKFIKRGENWNVHNEVKIEMYTTKWKLKFLQRGENWNLYSPVKIEK